jgi:hypothetical protein
MPSEPLPPVSPSGLLAFDRVAPDVEKAVVRQCLSEDSPEEQMGVDAPRLVAAGMGFVTKMVRAAMAYGAEAIMRDALDWGRLRLPVCGVDGRMMLRIFERYADLLAGLLPEENRPEIMPYLRFLVETQQRTLGGGD